MQLLSHCSHDLYNGIWLLNTKKLFNSAKFKNISDFFLSFGERLGPGAYCLSLVQISMVSHLKVIGKTNKKQTNIKKK